MNQSGTNVVKDCGPPLKGEEYGGLQPSDAGPEEGGTELTLLIPPDEIKHENGDNEIEGTSYDNDASSETEGT